MLMSAAASNPGFWSTQTLAVPVGVIIAASLALVGVIITLRQQAKSLDKTLASQRAITDDTLKNERLIAHDQRLWEPRSAVYTTLISTFQDFIDQSAVEAITADTDQIWKVLSDRSPWITWSSNSMGITIENLRIGFMIFRSDAQKARTEIEEVTQAEHDAGKPHQVALKARLDKRQTTQGQLGPRLEGLRSTLSSIVLQLKQELQNFHERSS